MASYTNLHFELEPDMLVSRLYQRMALQRKGHIASWLMVLIVAGFSYFMARSTILTQWPDLGHMLSLVLGFLIFPALADAFLWWRGNRPMMRRWESLLEDFRREGGNEACVTEQLSEQAYRTGCRSLSQRGQKRLGLMLLASSGMLTGALAVFHDALLLGNQARVDVLVWGVLTTCISVKWLHIWSKNTFTTH